MKKNKLFTFFTIFFLITMLSTSVFAFDTSNGGSWDAVSASSGSWGYTPYTGTRYIFRIECSDGVYRDIGYNNNIVDTKIKNKAALYYINHFQDSKYNMTQAEENRAKNVDEIVKMGSSLLGYNQVFKGSSYFDTKVSSTDKYDSSNGNYRHITLWIRGGSKNKGKVITNDFNLNASDIRKLANTIKSYAEAKDDKITLQQINDIIEGRTSYQIRAESLFKIHVADGSSKLKGLYDDKDISAYVKGSGYTILTFREAKALQRGAKVAPNSPLLEAYGYVTKGAVLLWEKDSPWYDEYSNLYTDFLKGSYKKKDFRYIGWDYIQIDNNNPFEPQEEATVVNVKHQIKDTDYLLMQPIHDLIKEGEEPKVYVEISKAYGYDYVGMDQFQPEEKNWDKEKKSIQVSYDGNKTYEITFWYKLQTRIRITGVNISNDWKPFYSVPKDVDEFKPKDLPYNFQCKESDYAKEREAYELKGYEVRYGVLDYRYTGEEEVSAESPTITKDIEVQLELDRDPKNAQVLIIFYYVPKYKVTVEHVYVNPITKAQESKKTISGMKIMLNERKELGSMINFDGNGTKYINLDYAGDDIEQNGFKAFYQTPYKLILTPTEAKDYTVTFYYTSQIIEVRHEKEDGTQVEVPVVKIVNPGDVEKPLEEYQLKKVELNKKDTEAPVTLKIEEGSESQELVFIYNDPELIFGKDKPPKENPDPKDPDYNNKVAKYKTGIIPNDLNNQFINQKIEKYYWVLNEKGEITIRLAIGHMEGNHLFNCSLNIPFDIYKDQVYIKAGTSIDDINLIKNKNKSDDLYDVYEGKLDNIYVPIWVPEMTYTITANVKYTYESSKSGTKEIDGVAETELTVVGAVYDFTVTNLDGGSITGDSMWHNALFSKGEEYKAKDTAIGQGITGQQPSKYYQAIKRGARFYFSVNTLGEANNQLEIVPRFYYVSADGKNIEEVTMKSDYMSSKRSINLNDTNRVTTEFSKERTMKNQLDNGATSKAGTVFEVGDYSKLTLNRNVNTPYLGIVNDVKARFAGKDLTAILGDAKKENADLYKAANHWYADYSVPNDAKFYKKNGTQVDENGCLVVYFSIITKDSANNEYLAYNLESPFVQTEKISEWSYERKDNTLAKAADYRLVLPKTSVNNASKNITTNNIWIEGSNKAGHTAVIIYSLKQNVSTRQNVTSAGTH